MAINLKDSKYYFNRELSWLEFNWRVLEEAMDTHHPILERLKFISIFSSNLDEFFMIRVGGLKDQIHARIHELPIDGMSPREQIVAISNQVHPHVEIQSRVLLEDILPALRRKGLRIRNFVTLRAEQKAEMRVYFKEKVFPVLTPLAVDPSHPFPQLRSLGLNLIVELKAPFEKGDPKIAVIPLPQILNRFVEVPGKNPHDFILLEDLITNHLDLLFPNMRILNVSEFRVTRNADMDLSEAEADDLLKLIERELRKRRLGTVVRLELQEKMSEESKRFLRETTGLKEEDIYEITGYLDLASFMFLMSLPLPEIKDPEFTPALREEITSSSSIFSAIRKRGILLYHPYDSFNHVVELVQEAARDPKVLAIKQTLYRTSGKSPIVQALKDAVANGKQVTALIELKARFDEENNIGWAKELERSGVNVVYGLLGLKTHCKILMIIRREAGTIRRYLHLGTGNYNDKTARIYSDFGYLTCDTDFGKDGSDFFNLLTGYSNQKEWRKFIISPINMRSEISALIKKCGDQHTAETPSRIRMIMNSLVDPEMIQRLYQASMAGVKIELIIRGICCLKPGLKGISENITVRSIVGRFLEHPRVYYFEYGGEEKLVIGSADLMQRNLNRRVELVFPIEESEHRERIQTIMNYMMLDNQKARILQSDGTWIRATPAKGEKPLNAQNHFLERAGERQRVIDTIPQKMD
ncbi:MAG: polyphosphate kinase 1 [Bacteroidia bacterium]|nr:polyphosphate kinase 1 [Bacteroidia bacterium]